MTISPTSIDGLLIIESRVFSDERGSFHESFNARPFREKISQQAFVQDNISISKKGVLRGLHFQRPPYAQAKLVSVLRGRALDVAVDLRKDSATYGRWHAVTLDEKDSVSFYVPRGFAHGFLALEDDTLFSYKCDNNYSKEHEDSLIWNDPKLNIDWGIDEPILSAKDMEAPHFDKFDSPFAL